MKKIRLLKFPKQRQAQVILEFTFCMVILMLMIYGVFRVFRWSAVDSAERRLAHDQKIFAPIDEGYGPPGNGPLKQIDPYFYKPIKMNAIWEGEISY